MIAKRTFDLFFSLSGLIILSPLFILITLLIKIDSKGPVFFRQIRAGKDRRVFRIIKFRTMVAEASDLGGELTTRNDSRITKTGAFLRRHKLDELPQLINVVKGEMSLVGPRPEVAKYTKCYPEQDEVFSVLPGITDPASIAFRDENDLLEASTDPEKTYIEEILPVKIKHYLDYVRNRSLWEDFLLILNTLRAITMK